MACNCKNKKKIEEKYGTKEDETLLIKLSRYSFKVFMFLVFVVLSIIVTPIMILAVIYTAIFKHDQQIMLPKFLSKYIK